MGKQLGDKIGVFLRDKDGAYGCYIPQSLHVSQAQLLPWEPVLCAQLDLAKKSWCFLRETPPATGSRVWDARVHVPRVGWVWKHREMPQHAPPCFVLSEGRST